MVGPRELESLTSCVSSRRSNQLSYGPGEGISQFIMCLRSRVTKCANPADAKWTKRPLSWNLSKTRTRLLMKPEGFHSQAKTRRVLA
jgi:hypothetical protein